MFCTQCGAQLPANAKFCTGCGQPVAGAATPPAQPVAVPVYTPPAAVAPMAAAAPPPPAAASGAAFAGMKATIKVELQGVDKALRANGSYDSVSMGKVTPQRLHEILLQLLPQQSPEGDDVCPIGIIASAGENEVSYMIDRGRITSSSGDREYSPEDAVRQVIGQATQAVKIKLPAGWKPLRHPELPPTDRDEADPTTVNTSSQPQVSAKIWVGDIAKYGYAAGWGLLGMSSLFLFVVFTQFTVKVFLAAALCVGVSIAIIVLTRKSGYQLMRMGADWATNTIWVNVDGRTHLTPDASCIQDFTVVTRTQTSTRGMGLKRRTYRTTVYKLDALMSNGKTEFMRGLDEMSKGKVEEVQRIGRELLGRLG